MMATRDDRRYERSRKESHLDTIYYEIDMLEFAFDKLGSYKGSQPAWNLLIEGFLLHYRNVIEFFSGRKHRKDDISIAEPEIWASRNLTRQELDELQVPAQELESEYWTDISQFLQHCTARRHAEFREWPLKNMYDRLKPITSAFEKSFPRASRSGNVLVRSFSLDAGSTATVTQGLNLVSPSRPQVVIKSPTKPPRQ